MTAGSEDTDVDADQVVLEMVVNENGEVSGYVQDGNVIGTGDVTANGIEAGDY